MDRGVGASAAVDFGKFKFLNAFCNVVFEIFPERLKRHFPTHGFYGVILALLKLKLPISAGDPSNDLAYGELG